MRHAFTLAPPAHVDGYVRLQEPALAQFPLVHLDSALDENLLVELRAEGLHASYAGYTEWQCPRTPGTEHITLGWDWYVDSASGVLLIAWGDIRSNVMCVDPRGADLGMPYTARALLRRVACLNWPNTVAQAALAPWGQPTVCGPTLQ